MAATNQQPIVIISDSAIAKIAIAVKQILTDDFKALIEEKQKTILFELAEIKQKQTELEFSYGEDLEQHSRKQCVRLSGVPYTLGENTDTKIIEITNKLGVDMQPNDITISHRTAKPRQIIARIPNQRLKKKLLQASKQLKDRPDLQEDIYDLLSSIGCSSFGNLLQGTGYMYRLGDDHSGPYTVFAPSDAAINNLPPEIVKIFNFGNWELAFDIVSYHITKDISLLASLQNNGLYDTMLDNSQLRFNVHTISGANITSPDNTATNGVVHVIDRMLYRFPEVYTTQYVHEHQNLSKISLLIDKGGLHDQLKAQNITMFVPNDEAFNAAPNFNMTNLLMNDTAIANFVSSLIVNSVYFTADLVNGQDLFTSQGSRIRINVIPGNITVNNSGISEPDLITKNGVVHIINKLL
ncbi:unnamed protein product [Mytilus edulis]|uniref:FAS1 domain-containing protein n=1 Tax=Mytilus edulis TaxID=6550 RepID=A0A8S3SWB4_MYTED|nr:unnamed protein product [Mytilus edulis]